MLGTPCLDCHEPIDLNAGDRCVECAIDLRDAMALLERCVAKRYAE